MGGTDVGVAGLGVEVGAGGGSLVGNGVFVGEGVETDVGEGDSRTIGVSIATWFATGPGVADTAGSAGTGVNTEEGIGVGAF